MVVAYHGGVVAKALQDLFPEIGLNPMMLLRKRWTDAQNRRKFFEEFAREHGFDPLNAEHWYSQDLGAVRASASGVMKYHKLNMAQALLELFPEVPFDRSRLRSINSEYKKRVFEGFAKRNGFDPLNPLNWAAQSRKKLAKLAGVIYLRGHYNGDIFQLLLHLFPNIGLVPSMFKPHSTAKWETAQQRKAFFEKYANDHNFDALDAENWYKHRPKIAAARRVQKLGGLLRYHGNNPARALVDLFPNIEFDKSRLF